MKISSEKIYKKHIDFGTVLRIENSAFFLHDFLIVFVILFIA